MPFCAPDTTASTYGGSKPQLQEQSQHSHFGDAYSVHSRSRSRNSQDTDRPDDHLEADYDQGATELYRCIENKDWDGALRRLENRPVESKTWVSRRDAQRMRWRLLPLHAVCIFRAPLALIEALLEVYPNGAQLKDDQGMLPLHLACRNGASKGVVLTLLHAYPDSIAVRDRKNRSPTDLVQSSQSANKETVLVAIQKFQRDLIVHGQAKPILESRQENQHEVDYENRTVLFRMILKKDWKAANARANLYPDEAATWIVTKGFHGNLRFLPLHKACVLQPTQATIQALLTAYPEAATAKDQDGWLPIHCACFYGANDSVVSALLEASPKGATVKDDEGRLPLHYACLKGASKAVLDVLLGSYAKAAMIKDDEGRLPIHHACSKGAPDDIVETLLKASPKGAQSKDDQGRLPLHHACRKKATERTIRTLLRVYPRAAQVKDDQDKLAVHYACQSGSTAPVVTILVQTYPEAVYLENSFGRTPVDEVLLLNNPKLDPVVKILEKAKKDQDRIKAAKNKKHDQTAAHVESLEQQVYDLQRTMGKVAILGREMKNDLKKNNKDALEILEKFSQALIELGGGGGGGANNKMPLKNRSTTKNIFGRSKRKVKA